MIITQYFPETSQYWIDVQRGIVSSHRERDSLQPQLAIFLEMVYWCGGTLNPTFSYCESIMSSNQIESNDVNGSQLAEQGPSSRRCSRQGNICHHHANPVISKRRKGTSKENKIVMESYLLSEPKSRGYRKRMLSLWLQKGIFWAKIS